MMKHFSPVARMESIRMFLSMSINLNFKIFQMDVKSAFLNKYLEEEVYMEQAEGFIDQKNPFYICKLKKALYGLKQAPRAWYERLDDCLHRANFLKSQMNNTLYIKNSKDNIIFKLIYVVDILLGSRDLNSYNDFVKEMKNTFEISMIGELSYFLGIQIHKKRDGIFLSQSKYLLQILEKIRMKDCKPISTPLSTIVKLSKYMDGPEVDQKQYRYLIGSFLYLMSTQPDIMH